MGIHQYRKPKDEPESLGIRLYTMKQAAKETGLAYGTLRRAVKEGRLKRANSHTHGWKFTTEELQRFVRSLDTEVIEQAEPKTVIAEPRHDPNREANPRDRILTLDLNEMRMHLIRKNAGNE